MCRFSARVSIPHGRICCAAFGRPAVQTADLHIYKIIKRKAGVRLRTENHDFENNLRQLSILSQQYPSIDAASTEIINLQAILNLPKGTELFLTDIHGEYETFQHVLKTASGVIKKKIEDIYGNSLSEADKKSLATLIYYPERKLGIMLKKEKNVDDWFKITLYRLIEICRSFSSKYTRSKVRKAIPKSFTYIVEELLHNDSGVEDKSDYYREIIATIIQINRAKEFIIALSQLIQRLAIDRLHVIGDIFDRGPGAAMIMDRLINFHSVDIQWGNHDILWLGACAGMDACIANVIRISAKNYNLDTIENGYGINLIPLATFAMEHYKDDPCTGFLPANENGRKYDSKEIKLIAQMHKAMTVIQFKLEQKVISRHPEFGMNDRLLLHRIHYADATVEINGQTYSLSDCHFPTVDPSQPYKLTAEEADLVEKLRSAFVNSEKLNAHARFLLSNGSLYLEYNSNLLYHGCIPMKKDGSFSSIRLMSKKLSGKALLDFLDVAVRKGFFDKDKNAEKQEYLDLIWYLWSGPDSPLFGKDKMATFEKYFLTDPGVQKETKNPYYYFRNSEDSCDSILREFGLNPEYSHIINGHIPVRKKNGESPIKANGKLIVIDGGFSKSYYNITGTAGYTLISDSYALTLISHEPFSSAENAIKYETDILSSTQVLERETERKKVNDTDVGKVIRQDIHNLSQLLDAYRNGVLKEKN